MRYVLDSSVAFKWAVLEVDTAKARQFRNDYRNGVHTLVAPDFFHVEVAHSLTRQAYILVRREAYERLKALLALDDYNREEGTGYINEVMAEDDAKDPYLERYLHFGTHGR